MSTETTTAAGSGTEVWKARFAEVYERGLKAYRQGLDSPRNFLGAEDLAFLRSIGHTAQEVFDFVEDRVNYGEPSLEEAVAVAALRREHFLGVQGGLPSGRVRSMAELPAKTDAVDGIAWLPRILVKARIKLAGEMPDDLMYGCGGDRGFLRGVRIGLAEFLAAVRDAGDDDRRVIDWVKRRRGGSGEPFRPA